MKKVLCLVMAFAMLLSLATPTIAASEIKVILDGTQIEFDVPPQIISGRTMVPLRAIFEALGASVDWNGTTRTVTSTKGDTTISLTVDKNVMVVNGKSVQLDTAAKIINGRTLVPVRAITEAFGMNVDWEPTFRKVTITYPTAKRTIGEVWGDEGVWEFTVNSVSTHDLCSSYNKSKYNGKKVLVINYSYKNINYDMGGGANRHELAFFSSNMDVFDDEGELLETYYCSCPETKTASYIKPGKKCTATIECAVDPDCKEVTLETSVSFIKDAVVERVVEYVLPIK